MLKFEEENPRVQRKFKIQKMPSVTWKSFSRTSLKFGDDKIERRHSIHERKTMRFKNISSATPQNSAQKHKLSLVNAHFQIATGTDAFPHSGTHNKKLQFENVRSSASRIHFTENERTADKIYSLPFDTTQGHSATPPNGDFTPQYVELSAGRKGFSFFEKVRYQLEGAASQEITKLADESENDAVRAADRTRRISRNGRDVGRAAGRLHWSRRKINEEKRLRKKEGKQIIQGEKERLYQMRTGKEAPSAIKRRKKQMKRRQLRQLAEQRFGAKKVDAAVQIFKFIAKAARKIVTAVVSWLGFPLLGIALIFICLFALAMMMFGTIVNTSVSVMSAYTSADADIEAASMLATRLEAELELAINGMPSQWEWGHIDEFRYDVDPIGHNPFELMAYLSVTHPGFDMGEQSPVHGVIEQLHNARYDLILEEQVETRYYTETYTDPVTGEVTEDEVPYDYYILNVILRSRGIEVTIAQQLKATPKGELWEWYGVLMETCGARQEFDNPFAGDWRGNVTSLYGYRLNPLGKNLQTHRGLDIAMPEGTPIAAGLSGRVQYVGNDTVYGKYIVIESEDSTTMKYAHCHTIQAVTGDSVTAGDNIATVGNTGTSTGSHVHIEIKREGQYLNPIYALEFGGNEE